LLSNFSEYFVSSDNQFGFKKNLGCSHAIFSVRSTVDYFVSRNSTVNICSLDVAKAFDRINHFTLFLQLMKKSVPVNIVIMLASWYTNSTGIVNWNGALSPSYHLSAGVRQGEVISPVIFANYVDGMISAIQFKGLGCHIGLKCMGIFMYADDLILVSGSVSDLQYMIDSCIEELHNLDLLINAKKSSCLRIGKSYKSFCTPLTINGTAIPWTDQITYLGVTIDSSVKFSLNFKSNRSKFYRSFNALYGRIAKANEYLIVSLVRSFCIPVVMHSLDSVNLNATSLNILDRLIVNVFSKIFKTFDKNILYNCMLYMDS